MADPNIPPAARKPSPAIQNPPRTAAPDPKANKTKKSGNFSSLPFWLGILISIFWIGIVFFAIAQAGPTRSFGGLSLMEWAIGISAIASPVALIWMVTAYLQRAADIQSLAEPLRRQLVMITGESGAAEARIRRFNQAIKEQLELMRSAQNHSTEDFSALLDQARDHKGDLVRFEQNSIEQVKAIQEIIRRNMQHVEQLMDDKFTMMRVLDDRLIQSGDTVGRQIESARGQVSEMLDAIEANSERLSSALERSASDSKKLADTARAQEASLQAAAESAAEVLSGVSGKIDLSIARFLERAGTARGEAERLAGTLEAQARSLDEFSNTLPVRVSEAEAVLRGVADRLYSSEQLAREQAVNLSDKLTLQVDGLQKFLDRLSDRLTGFDGSVQKRRDDLDGLLTRIGESTDAFANKWETSISDLNERTGDSLRRFTNVNDETRKSAEDITGQMMGAAERYENAAQRMQTLSADSAASLKTFTTEIASQLSQFKSLRTAAGQAGQDVENRASAALQNLQYVLERLLTAREATQSVGETLVKDLYSAVDQNEQLISRLNEAAQMSVRALGIAAESLGRQEGELASQARAASSMLQEAMTQTQEKAATAEKGLRDQSAGLITLLGEIQDKLNSTEQKLQTLTTQSIVPIQAVIKQVDASASDGLKSLNQYGDGLQEQLGRLQQFTIRVSGIGEEVGRIVGENVNSLEQLNTRFSSARAAQEDTARQSLEHFSSMADRLQREIGSLGDQTTQAVSTLQQAAAKVGEQSTQLLQDAQNSGSQMQIVTSALQTEASQIRNILQKQTDDLGADLSRAEKQFLTIGEALKQRTDAAYSLLDRVASHYNEVTRSAAQELEARAQRFEQSTSQAQTKADAFGSSLSQQLGLINNGAAQLEAQTAQIASISGKATQQLSSLNEKLTLTHEAANNNAQQTLNRLEECNSAFIRQSNALADVAQSAAVQVQKSGLAFGEQASKLLDNSQQTEQHIRNLAASTVALAEQTGQVRSNMEQQNQRLLAQLAETAIQLDSTSDKLQQTAATATTSASEAAERLKQTTQDATSRLGNSQQELEGLANRTEATLSSLGTNIAQQTASLAVVQEQLDEQFRTFSAANENQRSQLVDLFDKLGSAHSQASDVAERTIVHLTDSLSQIQRQLGALSDQSQSTVANVRAAGTGFSEQAGSLLQNAQQAEQQARTILSVTGALQDQARQLREALHTEGDRTNELLGAILGKISAGGSELRELSTTADLTLNNLQNGVTQQTTALNATMQQISDKQRSLTVALDAQRDVINGLLSRLALAQDETAATAERSVARLTDSTQQLAKQLGVIDSQAQSALSGVQAAGAKFADEAGSMGLHAQQAEQQMRAVLSVTAGMQEQARNLRESMQGETARAVEQLTGIITQLNNASDQLKQQSGAAIHVLDQSALQMETITRNSGEQLQKHAETLNNVSSQAEARISSTDEKIRGHLRLVSDVTEQTEQQGAKITSTIETAVGNINTLRDALSESDKQGYNTLTDITARIDGVRSTLESELERLTNTSQAAMQQLTAASQTAVQQTTNAAQELATQSDTLRANLASSESALAEAARLVRDETVQLPATLDRSTAHIEGAGELLKSRAQEAEKTLVGTADRFITVTGAARETMVDEMKQVSRIANESEDILRQFSKTLAEQVQSMQHSTGLLAGGQKELVVKATESISHLASASEKLSQLRNDASGSAEKLAREFENLESRASATSQTLLQTGETVDKNLEALSQATSRAEGQMLAASNSFREQFERIRTGTQGQIDDINRGLMQITAQLERTGTALRSTTAGTVADVEKISARFEQTSKEGATQLIDKTARMRTTTEEVAKLLVGLGDQLDVLLNRLAVAGDGIKRHEGSFVSQLQTALSHLGSVAERLETSRTLAGNVTEHAVSRLSEVAATVEQQVENLANKSEATANVMNNVSRLYGDQTQSLNRGVQEAQSQVVAMNRSIEDMQQRTDRLRVSLKLQGEELMGSLGQILTQLESTGDDVGETVEQVLRERAAGDGKKSS